MNKSKQKGTRAETNIVKALQAKGIVAERRALAGSEDKGDIKVILNDGVELIIEVKAGKQTANPSRTDLSIWFKQTLKEMTNACSYWGVLIICSYRKQVKDYPVYIYTQGEASLRFMFFDEFIKWLQVMNE